MRFAAIKNESACGALGERARLIHRAAALGAMIVALYSGPVLAADAPSPSPAQLQFFESKVRPVLVENCQKCHGEKKQESSLRLDSRAAILTGGDRGPAVVPEKPDDSLLLKAVNHEADLEMPPKPSRQLSKEQIANLTTWVKSGAAWPGDQATAGFTPRRPGMKITDRDRAHWAFQPVKRPSLPPVKETAWVANPIDAFVLAKLEAKGLHPNPPAEKHELIRRLYYDLTGLPPTPAEVDAFVADASPGAYEAVVDRLLASPHYGEHWARHWMDLVRYAESNSYERDDTKPHVWRFRDYLIRSFNHDKPYDRLIREQLAGDELPDADRESLIATGYYRLGVWDDDASDKEAARYEGLDDMVATTGQVFLGLTVDCARCHDHKIDPIPQRDYYRLVSFFNNVNYYQNGGPTVEATLPAAKQINDASKAEASTKHAPSPPAPLPRRGEGRLAANVDSRVDDSAAADQEELDQFRHQQDEARKHLQRAISGREQHFLKNLQDAHEKNLPAAGSAEFATRIAKDGERVLGKPAFEDYKNLQRQLADLNARLPASKALVVTEAGRGAPDTFILLRGNPQNRGDKVTPAFLEVLGNQPAVIPTPSPDAKTCGRRLVLANWIASPDNPLTARVMANRVWQYHFGRGIVRSPNNFGTQGDRPTHPELLDWLASQLVADGWRLKSLHRLIVTSNAYRMSSRGNAQAATADPQNDLFWRFDMRRLTAEETRDSILAASGSLNLKMYGPSIFPEMPAEVLHSESMPGRNWGKSSEEEQSRRSVYIHAKRSLPLPLLEAYDLAEADHSSPVRFSTTQATQALEMLNSKFLNDQAGRFAVRLKREAGNDRAKQVRLALRIVACRAPTEAEIQKGLSLIDRLKTRDKATDDDALRYFCLMALNLNEFVYLD